MKHVKCWLAATMLATAPSLYANGVLQLDGSGDHVLIEHGFFHQTFTIEVEVNSPLQFFTGAGDFGGLVAYTNQTQSVWETNLDEAGCAVLAVNFGQGSLIQLNDGCAVPTNQWTHLAFVFDHGTIRIYRDGVLRNESVSAVPASDIANGFTVIGVNPALADEYYNGMMDEVRIWSVARTDAEIEAGRCWVDPGTPGLEAYWSFDDIGATTAYDSTPHARNGQLMGGAVQVPRPIESPAVVNGVLLLTGDGDYVHINHTYLLEALTIEMQVRSHLVFPNGAEDFGGLLACSNESQAVWETNLDENGCAVLVLNFGQEWMVQQSDGCTVVADRWTHLAFVYDESGVILIYVDGELRNTLAAGVTLSPVSGASTYIGLNPAINNEYFSGLIDEVRIWDHARSASDIAASPCSVNPATPGLAGYWKFDQIGSCTAYDSSPGLHHGTLRNRAAQVPVANLATDFATSHDVVPRGGTVQFTDLTTGGDVDSWFWQFGDGGTSHEQNPAHVYGQVGIYDVTLTTTTLCTAQSLSRQECIRVLDVCEMCWFHEDWESGTIDPSIWKPFGHPPSVLVEDPCGSGLSLIPNGDSNYESGAASLDGYDLALRPRLVFRASGSTGPGVRSLRAGWAVTNADAYNDPPDMPDTELATISIVPEEAFLLISYGIQGDGFQEPWDPAWNGLCMEFEIAINLDGTVSFFRDGVLRHRTSSAIDLASWSEQALIVFGRGPVTIDDIDVLPPSAEPEEILFVEGWESGVINPTIWKIWGSPAPVLAVPGHESGHALNTNGDGTYESGLASWLSFDLGSAPAVSFWAKGSSGPGHHSAQIAIAETTADAYNEPPDTPSSELMAISLAPQDGYDLISYGMPGDGYQEPWNQSWNNLWQHFMMRVNPDGTASFYRNGHLRHHTTQSIPLEQWSAQSLVVFGREGVLVDDLLVTAGNPVLGPVTDLHIVYLPAAGAVELSWSPVPFATGYKVYRLPSMDAVRTESHVVSVQCTSSFIDTVAPTDQAVYMVVAIWE